MGERSEERPREERIVESKFSLKSNRLSIRDSIFLLIVVCFFFPSEYEEDFEVDEEKQDEKPNEEGQADDQMNGMSKSPSDDEKDHLAPEKESETLSREAADADDNVKDEGDGCSDSELEEHKQGKLFPDHVTCAVQQVCSLVFSPLYLMG